MVDTHLRSALMDYNEHRLANGETLRSSSPLFVTQKDGPYSPNTLHEHMALMMLREWTGIEKTNSHSGRRSLITHIIHKQKKSVKVAQKISGQE